MEELKNNETSEKKETIEPLEVITRWKTNII